MWQFNSIHSAVLNPLWYPLPVLADHELAAAGSWSSRCPSASCLAAAPREGASLQVCLRFYKRKLH